jgi:hypothetical protein
MLRLPRSWIIHDARRGPAPSPTGRGRRQLTHRQAQSFAELLQLAHTGTKMAPLWHAAQAAAADCRRHRGTSSLAPVHSAQRTRRIQKDVIALCLQSQYRCAMCLLDRKPLLDLRVPGNLQRVRDVHPRSSARVVARTLLGCRMRPNCPQR